MITKFAFALFTILVVFTAFAQQPSAPSVSSALEERNEALVLGFYDEVLNRRQPEAAVEFLTENYIQHNPTVPTGRAGFIAAFTQFFEQFPQATFDIRQVFTDGDHVIVHSFSKTTPEDRGTAIVDIYRVHNGKLAEHWDVLQAVPETSANTNGMF